MTVLNALYFSFSITPWSTNVARGLIKEPKYYLWDWSIIEDPGQRFENLTACALLKAVDFWNDHGMGKFGLHFVRDRDGREVDFLITKKGTPWILLECKLSNQTLAAALHHHSQQLRPDYTLQIVWEAPFTPASIEPSPLPQVVSGRTFLSQLI